jgi:hypothetical protein
VECSALTQFKLKDVFDEVSFFLFECAVDHILTSQKAIVAALEPPQTKKPKSMSPSNSIHHCEHLLTHPHREGQGLHIVVVGSRTTTAVTDTRTT